MAEAESVLPARPKMAPSMFASTDIPFRLSSPPEPENMPHPTFPPASSSVSSLSEKLHITDESILSPTPTKPSTLKKYSGKKKQSKSLKGTDSKNCKKTPRRSPDQSDRDIGECPYSDLDSVPKILCPKALERQAKLAPSQPSVSAVKELKKQPDSQSGLWFSKSGKERRPKTTNPVPDRSLFSKVPNKKKNGSTFSKKTLVSSASSLSGATSDQASPEKHKPTHNHMLLEQSGPSKHKTTKSSTKLEDRSGSSVDHSEFLSQKALLSVESSKVKQMESNSADTVPNPASGLLSSSDVIRDTVPSKKDQFYDQSIDLKSEQKVSQAQLSTTIDQKQVSKTDKIFDQEKESNKTSVSCLEAKTDDSESSLENQLGLVSSCRLPFVKLIRKEIKEKYLNSTVTVSPISQVKCTKKKISDANGIETYRQLDQIDKSSSSTGNSGPMKVAVKKLKASGGSDVLRLSDSLHSDAIDASNKCADELVFRDSEKISVSTGNPNNVTQSFSNQPDQSQQKTTSDQTNKSSDQLGNVDQSIALATAINTTPQPSKHNEVPVCSESVVPGSPSSKESTRDFHNSKLVSDENEVLNKQPAHLPASNGLMTRALKAMHEVDQKKHEKDQKEVEQKHFSSSSENVEDLQWKPQVKQDVCTKIKFVTSQYVDSGECEQGTSSCCSSPSVMFSDLNDFEPDVKSEDEDFSISSTPSMDFIPLTSKGKEKHEGQSSNILSTSPPSPFSFMKDFKNVEEVSFQSLTNMSDGKLISFKTDKKYKFSTFLMMLKDLHDTREREGTPLELEIGPPSSHVKLEPLVLPQEAPSEGHGQNMDFILSRKGSSPNKSKVTQSQCSANQKPKRPYNRKGSHWLKRKNNRRAPHSVRSGPGFLGLDSLSKKGLESLSKVDQSSRILEIQSSSWESRAECGKGEVERWRRLKGNQQIAIPLKQKERDSMQETGLLNFYTKDNTGLMLNVGERSQAVEGKYSLHRHRSTLYNFCARNWKNMGFFFKLPMKIDKLDIFVVVPIVKMTDSNCLFYKTLTLLWCYLEHKRIRKPSKRLIEWTEEYNQIFPRKKKTKKPLQLSGKVKILQSKALS